MSEEARGLALKWDQSADEAITCLVLIANGGHWTQWEQAHGDTRGIVTERAAMAIKAIQRGNARHSAALVSIRDICNGADTGEQTPMEAIADIVWHALEGGQNAE